MRPDGSGGGLLLEEVRVVPRGARPLERPILSVDRLALASGAAVALTGPSGAGKSTLLGVLSGIVVPSTGRVRWNGEDLASLPERGRDLWRRRTLGIVFQDFHLVPELSAYDNVVLPAGFDGLRVPRALRERAEALLARVGLSDPRRRAGLMSRGEQQRTALARALLPTPRVILADEPTASLDEENGRAVADLLVGAASEFGATLVVATHDPALVARLSVRWRIRAGRVETGEGQGA